MGSGASARASGACDPPRAAVPRRGVQPRVPGSPNPGDRVKQGLLLLLAVLCLGVPAGAAANTVLTPSDSTAMDWSRVPEYRILPGDQLELDFGHRPEG